MICNICRRRPARAQIGPGPKPQRCQECYRAKTTGRREAQLDQVDRRIQARVDLEAIAVQRLPRRYCRCDGPIAKREGPLVVCALCSREVVA